MTPLRRVAGRLLVAAVVALGTFVLCTGPVAADEADEQQLAELYAPVMLLEVQEEACGPGEPYEPSDVDPLLTTRRWRCGGRGRSRT